MICILVFLTLSLFADSEDCLLRDLAKLQKINQEIDFELPYVSNYTLQGGYFTMPSARMQKSGFASAMFSNVSPYHIYSLSFQLYNRLELSGNYWVFKGMTDPGFGAKGFGDSADRAGNFRLSLIHQDDGFETIPEIVFGANDFFGSKRFCSYYLVATKQLKDYLLELSLGWGSGRIKGFFGGAAFSPFAKEDSPFKSLSFIAEYDANDYKHHKEEHPKGRSVKYPINFGAHIKFLDYFSFNVSSIRGKDIAYSAAFNYNIGRSKGIFGRKNDVLPFKSPVDHEPLGLIRKDKLFAQEMAFAFQEQGLNLYEVKSFQDHLWLKVVNQRYRKTDEVRFRIETLLATLVSKTFKTVTVVIESEGLAVLQYDYRVQDLYLYENEKLARCVLQTISPAQDVKQLCNTVDECWNTLYHRRKKIWNLLLRPRFNSFFGSTTGKFKYDLSFITDLQGYLFDQVYYQFLSGYTISSSTQDMGSCDWLNPSQIINVRTDKILYHQKNSLHVEKLYLQKAFNHGCGFFTRYSLGYFEPAYGGGCFEALYYPVTSPFAIGIEAALLKKRKYSGMNFTNKIRKYKGKCPEFVSFPYAFQYFLDIYYENTSLLIDAKISLGQFLAKDKGARFEVGRNFCNGVRLHFWYTFTNGDDVVNGSRYYDHGVGFSIPMELLTCKSSKENLGYSMSAWLRDVGARAQTGKTLYSIIYSERTSF